GALVIGTDALFNSRSEQLAGLALRHAVPAIYQFREFVSAGGLMLLNHRCGHLPSARRLHRSNSQGRKPADLPGQQATRLDMIINMKTARALGISVPLPLTGRADEVIE